MLISISFSMLCWNLAWGLGQVLRLRLDWRQKALDILDEHPKTVARYAECAEVALVDILAQGRAADPRAVHDGLQIDISARGGRRLQVGGHRHPMAFPNWMPRSAPASRVVSSS